MYVFRQIKDTSVTRAQAEKEALSIVRDFFYTGVPRFKDPKDIEIKESHADNEDFFQLNATSTHGLTAAQIEEKARKALEDYFDNMAKVNKMPNFGEEPNNRKNKFRIVGFKIIPTDEFVDDIKDYLSTLEPEKDIDYKELIKEIQEDKLGDYEIEEKDED